MKPLDAAAIGLVVLVLALAFGQLAAEQSSKTPTKPIVAAIFYSWYGYDPSTNSWPGGYGTSHWNDGPYGQVCEISNIGYYASLNNRTLAWQFSGLSDLGVTVLLAEWDGQPQTDAAVRNLFRYIENSGSPIRVALMVDLAPSKIDYEKVYEYTWKVFAGPYGRTGTHENIYFTWNGRPLLVWFNLTSPKTDQRFTVRTIGDDLRSNWGWARSIYPPSAFGGSLTGTGARWAFGNPPISSDGVVTVISHYNDYGLYLAGSRPGYIVFDNPNLWRAEWSYVDANQARVRMAIINSWNEYHERTAIEPSVLLNSTTC